MTKDELNKLDDALAKEQALIEDQLGQFADKSPIDKNDYIPRVPNYDDDDHNEDDYAHEVTDFDRNVAMVKQLEDRLREIKRTRGKIKDGSYGKCENCSQVIAKERLKVMPVASLCMSCASRDR